MIWETPKVVEIRMDAEIGSYQEDFGGDEDPRFVSEAVVRSSLMGAPVATAAREG